MYKQDVLTSPPRSLRLALTERLSNLKLANISVRLCAEKNFVFVWVSMKVRNMREGFSKCFNFNTTGNPGLQQFESSASFFLFHTERWMEGSLSGSDNLPNLSVYLQPVWFLCLLLFKMLAVTLGSSTWLKPTEEPQTHLHSSLMPVILLICNVYTKLSVVLPTRSADRISPDPHPPCLSGRGREVDCGNCPWGTDISRQETETEAERLKTKLKLFKMCLNYCIRICQCEEWTSSDVFVLVKVPLSWYNLVILWAHSWWRLRAVTVNV